MMSIQLLPVEGLSSCRSFLRTVLLPQAEKSINLFIEVLPARRSVGMIPIGGEDGHHLHIDIDEICFGLQVFLCYFTQDFEEGGSNQFALIVCSHDGLLR